MSNNFSAWTHANKNPQPKNLSEAMSLAVSYAVLAPSAHNTQPWFFEINDNKITISLNKKCLIGSSDPNNMLAQMSLGCAKSFLETALYRMGVNFASEGLTINCTTLESPNNSKDFDAIFHRRSNRFIFEERKVSDNYIDEMKSSINYDANFYFINDTEQIKKLAKITADATETAYADKNFRHELAHYLRNNLTRKNDGMPGYVVGAPTPLSFLASTVIRNVNIGKQEGKQVEELFNNVSVILVATSDTDSIDEWIKVGEQLGKVLLRAQSLGLQAGWFAAPIVIKGEFRSQIAETLSTEKLPQMLLRIGFPTKIQRFTPRKKAQSVIK